MGHFTTKCLWSSGATNDSPQKNKNRLNLAAFHSCVGGCNGCINIDQGDNGGLAEALAALEDKYSKLGLADLGVSRADFWALAGMVAVEKAASLQSG